MEIKLSKELGDVLLKIAFINRYDIYPLVIEEFYFWDFSKENRESLIDFISNELVSNGLLPSGEPNFQGIQMEQLIDKLNIF